MDILFYNGFSLRVGTGPEHWLMDVAPRLQQLGNQVTIISPIFNELQERFSSREVAKRLGKVKYEEFSCMKFPKLSATPLPTNLLGTFGKKADVIYFLNGFALQDVFVTMDKMLTRTPTICGLHGPVITTYGLHNLYVQLVFRRTLRLFDACHALNPSYIQLLNKWGINNAYLIPNGIDTEKFHPLPKKAESGKFKVLFIGRFAYEKGIDILCKAIGLMTKEKEFADKFEFTLVGRGPMATIVQQLSGAHSNVKVESFVAEEDLAKVYSSHNLFVLPARFETFPLPPLEAQACGLPVITTDIPGTREQIRENAGSIIEVGNYPALASEIKKYYLAWRDQREQFELKSEAARANVLENFELGQTVFRINAMLNQVARHQHPVAAN